LKHASLIAFSVVKGLIHGHGIGLIAGMNGPLCNIAMKVAEHRGLDVRDRALSANVVEPAWVG